MDTFDRNAKKLGRSRALIEISLKSELGRFNVHKENKRSRTTVMKSRSFCTKKQMFATDTMNTCSEKERDTFKANLKQIASHACQIPSSKQRIDELHASIEDKKRERNRFKAQAEEAQSKLNVCDEKLTLLLERNWWQRLWDISPWIEK